MPRKLIQRYYQTSFVPNNVTLPGGGGPPGARGAEADHRPAGRVSRQPLPEAPFADLFRAPCPRVAAAERPASEVVSACRARSRHAGLAGFRGGAALAGRLAASPLAALVEAGDLNSFPGPLHHRDFAVPVTLDSATPGPARRRRPGPWQRRAGDGECSTRPPELLRTYQLKAELDEIYNLENIHYLGMWKGELAADLPIERLPDFFGDPFVKRIRAVDPAAARAGAEAWLGAAAGHRSERPAGGQGRQAGHGRPCRACRRCRPDSAVNG